eukprot:3787221-Amphidinium_carterae.1
MGIVTTSNPQQPSLASLVTLFVPQNTRIRVLPDTAILHAGTMKCAPENDFAAAGSLATPRKRCGSVCVCCMHEMETTAQHRHTSLTKTPLLKLQHIGKAQGRSPGRSRPQWPSGPRHDR